MFDFSQLPLWANLSIFILATSLVWISGTKLSIYAHTLSKRTGLSHAFMGFLLLATITELPEIATNSTGALIGEAELVLNSMAGGITMQTSVLAIADFTIAGASLTYLAQKSINILQSVLLILLLTIMLVITILGDIPLIWHIGLGSTLLFVIYLVVLYLLYHYNKDRKWQVIDPIEIEEEKIENIHADKYEGVKTKTIWYFVAFLALVIFISGIFLVLSAQSIAQQSGLGKHFIGATLLATATSMPELSTSISAVRLRAYTMAISDIIGSNTIMLMLLLPVDIFYSEGLLLNKAGISVSFILCVGIILTSIYLIGLIMRKKRTYLRVGVDSLAVLVLFILSLFLLYELG
jgi:cation:H+ antiporter